MTSLAFLFLGSALPPPKDLGKKEGGIDTEGFKRWQYCDAAVAHISYCLKAGGA
jgi:hypothetical protein